MICNHICREKTSAYGINNIGSLQTNPKRVQSPRANCQKQHHRGAQEVERQASRLVNEKSATIARPIVNPSLAAAAGVAAAGTLQASHNVSPSPEGHEQKEDAGNGQNVEEQIYHLLQTAQELFDVVGSGKVKIEVNQTYALKDAAQAHIDLEARKTTGSTVLLP